MEKSVCVDCGESGGAFILRNRGWVHKKCDPKWRGTAENVNGVFPYTTANFDGKPVQVESIRHMRQLERQHGVASVALNMDSQNWER